jgi:hypothetical protein
MGGDVEHMHVQRVGLFAIRGFPVLCHHAVLSLDYDLRFVLRSAHRCSDGPVGGQILAKSCASARTSGANVTYCVRGASA